jgi:hypothetical protein
MLEVALTIVGNNFFGYKWPKTLAANAHGSRCLVTGGVSTHDQFG